MLSNIADNKVCKNISILCIGSSHYNSYLQLLILHSCDNLQLFLCLWRFNKSEGKRQGYT